jgi:CxxC motif-containing protein (DUF1111 family)
MKLRPIFFALALVVAPLAQGQGGVVDPGPRPGPSNVGQPLAGTIPQELGYFLDGQSRFATVEVVTGGTNNGLGPTFNSNSCVSCHAYPASGGTSPPVNPQIGIANVAGATNVVPWFITTNGPVREARLQSNPDGSSDGGVHDVFVITGRQDAAGCRIAQPDFSPAGNPLTGQGGNPNVIFRIPTPTFGLGLIESISDAEILSSQAANASHNNALGIRGAANRNGTAIAGVANHSGNDGTITRFGWKAQNKSLLIFSGEAYNVEMGVTNQLFPQERDETPGCQFNATPEDTSNFGATTSAGVLSDVEAFANFMRFLAPPTPAPNTPSTLRGAQAFAQVGCSGCHTPSMVTKLAVSGSSKGVSAALSNQTVALYSDLLIHHMGTGLADGITQGGAGPDQFRSAPLWGVGQRLFFLHDGRTSNIVSAIEQHASQGSEANTVIFNFNAAPPQTQQDIVNFLRHL